MASKAEAQSVGIMARTEDVLPSPRNPRKHFDKAKLADLEANVKAVGRILAPLVTRPYPNRPGKYETLAGHRRLKVASAIGLKEIPIVNLGEISNDLALEILLIENLHHEDVLPLEEAAGFDELLKLKGYTVELIAQKVSKPVGYISRMLRLLRLIAPLKKCFLDGVITIAHAFAICKLTEVDQAKLIAKDRGGEDSPLFEVTHDWNAETKKRDIRRRARPVRELRTWIRNNLLLSLSDAPWKKDDAKLVPSAGPCNLCPKRTGNQVALWEDEDLKPGDDRCLDAGCYHEKKQAFVSLRLAEHVKTTGVEPVQIVREYASPEQLKQLGSDVIGQNEFIEIGKGKGKDKTAGEKTCANQEVAMVVDGEGVGRPTMICRKKGCPVHRSWESAGASGVKQLSPAEVWKQRRKNLDERLKLEVTQTVFCELLLEGPKTYRRHELDVILETMISRALNDRLRTIVQALAACKVKGFVEQKRFDVAIRNWAKQLDDAGVTRLIYAFCFADGLSTAPYLKNPQAGLLKAAAAAKVDVKGLTRAIEEPARKAFEEKKAKALRPANWQEAARAARAKQAAKGAAKAKEAAAAK